MNSTAATNAGIQCQVGHQSITIETGELAKQADGSVTVRLGDSMVLVTVVAAREPKTGSTFLPLTVDYRERTYAAGKIPGGFFKREGRPREGEILTSRITDRSIRPLFPKWVNREIQLAVTVLSSDQVNDTDILAVIGASAALGISCIPFKGPLGAVRIGRVNDQWMINPTIAEQDESDLDLVVSGTKEAIIMVEGGAHEVPEEALLAALDLAHREIRQLCNEQEVLIRKVGRPKWEPPVEDASGLERAVAEGYRAAVQAALRLADKAERDVAMTRTTQEAVAVLEPTFPGQTGQIKKAVEKLLSQEGRRMILEEGRRADGRRCDEIRPIRCQVGVLPRTHGSALFTRGQTQALATITLGTPSDMQVMDVLEGEYKERFLFHYNFPGFSTGEPKPDRGPGRREIGHGALARRALTPLLPSDREFPYTIRVVSDILESNGSSSMASVCGASLAFFDAGVPLKTACAGIAMGLIKEGDRHAVLTDIMGLEDHLGDMDFKVAGTLTGVTALQMDLKTEGIHLELIGQALQQARTARLEILKLMQATIDVPRQELSLYAPRMVTIQIPVDKIGGLIGPGGKNIRRIIEDTGVEVEVEDDGRVFIAGVDPEGVAKAKQLVEWYTAEAKVGETYTGKVTRIMSIGVFVEILPGKEGLIRLNQLGDGYVEDPTTIVKEGESTTVKVIEIDSQGRINLSRRAVLHPEMELPQPASGGERHRSSRPWGRGERSGGRPRSDRPTRGARG